MHLKRLSIFIVTCIGVIILAFFVFAGNNMINRKVTALDVAESISKVSNKTNLSTIGQITIDDTNIDYEVTNTSTKKKAVLNIFNKNNIIYGMEYYELDSEAYVYLTNEKIYVTLPYKFKNEGRLIDVAKSTLIEDRPIHSADKVYKWNVEPTEFIDFLVSEFDIELNKVLEDLKNQLYVNDQQLASEDIEDLKNFILEEVLTKDPVEMEMYQLDDAIMMRYLINTNYGTLTISEENKEYIGEIDIREIEQDKVISFEDYE